MLKKWRKYLLTLATIGTAIGLGIAFFKKRTADQTDENEFSDDFEDEDFDLDSDLEPVSEREYVSLNKSVSNESAAEEAVTEDK